MQKYIFKQSCFILLQVTPVALINTITVLERVANSLDEIGLQSSNVGSSLVQTITEFADKVILPPDQNFLNIQTENITGKVNLFCI